MAVKEGGTITIKIHCDNEEMDVSIIDDGIGMAREQIESNLRQKRK
ncbi:hypothetical protein [Maridesulfovibrio sp.]